MQRLENCLLLMGALGCATAAIASETITYTYDARGRLVRVVTSNGANTVTTNYSYDKANNREAVNTTGAPK